MTIAAAFLAGIACGVLAVIAFIASLLAGLRA